MDGSLARGYTRQSLRRFESGYPSALADVSLKILPYYQALCRKGTLTRQQAREAVSVYHRHLSRQPHVAEVGRFADTAGFGLRCLRLNLARRANGQTALLLHAGMMRAQSGHLEFRGADLPLEIAEHAAIRLLERGDETISGLSASLLPHLLMARLFTRLPLSQPYPVAVPHRSGLFLGNCRMDRDNSGVLSRIMAPQGEGDAFFPFREATGLGGTAVTLTTFIGEKEMVPAQRHLHGRLCDLARRFAPVLRADCLDHALHRPLGEACARGPEQERQDLQDEFETLLASSLWTQTVRAPDRKAAPIAVPSQRRRVV